MEYRKLAEDKGSDMGLAAGILKLALTILSGAKKVAPDAGTQGACDVRMKLVKETYDDTAMQMSQVYYEQEAGPDAIGKLEFESKNFTTYRSIEEDLNGIYKYADKFNCFTPTAVRQLESELF